MPQARSATLREAGEFVVLPVDARGPVVEHQPRKQRGRGYRRVVRAAELGIGQQGVEEPSG